MRKGGDWDKNVSWSGLESDIRREWVGKPDKSWSGHCQVCKSWGKPWGKVHCLFWSSVSASQPTGRCGPDNDTWPCAHAQQHHVGALAKTFHVKEHFILDYLGEEMSQQQVFCSDHKSLVVPWGPLSFSQGSLVHSTKTVLQSFLLGIKCGIKEKVNKLLSISFASSPITLPICEPRATSHVPWTSNYDPQSFWGPLLTHNPLPLEGCLLAEGGTRLQRDGFSGVALDVTSSAGEDLAPSNRLQSPLLIQSIVFGISLCV